MKFVRVTTDIKVNEGDIMEISRVLTENGKRIGGFIRGSIIPDSDIEESVLTMRIGSESHICNGDGCASCVDLSYRTAVEN